MKRSFLLILSALLFFSSHAQGIKIKNLRNSMTMLITRYDNNPTTAYLYASKLGIPEMFDDNSFGDNLLYMNGGPIKDNSFQIEMALEAGKFGQKILRTILYDEQKNEFTKEIMFSRGEYTATDLDYKVAMDSKKKDYVLKDMGEWLMKNIYVEVIDCREFVDWKAETYGDYSNKYLNALNSAQQKTLIGEIYLYKLDIDEVLEDQSFWNLIDFENNNNSVRENFNNYSFQFKKIKSTPFKVTESQAASGFFSAASELLNVYNPAAQQMKSDEQLLTSMLEKAIEKSHATLCSSLPNFSIGQSVFDIYPVRIKVGKKQSLKNNALYEITEYVDNDSTEHHVAWVRAKRVADNRFVSKGKSTPSTFYKVAGGAIKKGMTAKYVPQKGIEIAVGHNGGNTLISGSFVELTSFYFGVPKTRWGLRGIFGNARTDISENASAARNNVFFTASNINVEGFLNHTMKIGFLRLIPKIGMYYSMGTIKNYEEKGRVGLPMSDWGATSPIKFTSLGFTTGAALGLNFGRNFQLSFRYDYFSPLDNPVSSTTLTYNRVVIDPIFKAKGVYGVGVTLFGF